MSGNPQLVERAQRLVREGWYPSLDQALMYLQQNGGLAANHPKYAKQQVTNQRGNRNAGGQGEVGGSATAPQATRPAQAPASQGGGADLDPAGNVTPRTAPAAAPPAPAATEGMGGQPPAAAPAAGAPPVKQGLGIHGDPAARKTATYTPKGKGDPIEYAVNTNREGVQSNGDDDPWMIGAFEGGTYDPEIMNRWFQRYAGGDPAAGYVLKAIGFLDASGKSPYKTPEEWAAARNLTSYQEAFAEGGKYHTPAGQAIPDTNPASQAATAAAFATAPKAAPAAGAPPERQTVTQGSPAPRPRSSGGNGAAGGNGAQATPPPATQTSAQVSNANPRGRGGEGSGEAQVPDEAMSSLKMDRPLDEYPPIDPEQDFYRNAPTIQDPSGLRSLQGESPYTATRSRHNVNNAPSPSSAGTVMRGATASPWRFQGTEIKEDDFYR